MSVVCILTPVVIASWPAFSAAVVAAASSLGYVLGERAVHELTKSSIETKGQRRVTLQVPQSEIVTEQLGRDQRISLTREGVTISFSRDARGQAELCVEGQGHTEAALRAAGEELSQRVVQKYVYHRLMDEMRRRQFVVVEEETDANNAIRLKVRHWEN